MVEISKENDYMLQRLEREYSQNPDDLEVLNKYSDFIWNCLSQNLMQGQVEVINRELFDSLMQKKTSLEGSVTDYARMVENNLIREQFTLVGENLSKMKSLFPQSEEYYLLELQYLASLGRGEDIKNLLNEIDDKHIFLSSKSKEVLAFWEG
jgi:hypothetical protein